MKYKLPVLAAAVTLFSLPAMSDQILGVRIGSVDWSGTFPGYDAWSDDMPDATTVRATMMNNTTLNRWEFRLWNYQTASPDLTSGLDVTLGTEISASFNLYGLGDPQSPQWIYVHGANVNYVNFQGSVGISTLEIHLQPVAPAISASYGGGYTAALGIDFAYSGVAQNPSSINYAPPIVVGDVLCADVGAPQHPSSAMLHGAAISVNGVNGQATSFDFLYGSNFAASQGFAPDQAEAYLDWMVPASGFSFTSPETPAYTVDLGHTGETYYHLQVFNQNFSTHDIQVGVFPQPLTFTGISREPTGIRLLWNADTNKTYTLESFETLGGPTNILGTGLTGPGFLDTNTAGHSERYYRLREE